IAIEHQDGFLSRHAQRLANRPARAQRRMLHGIVDLHPAKLRAKVLLDHLMQIADRQNHTRASRTLKLANQYFEKWSARHRSHRLRHTIEPAGQPRAESAGKNDRFHTLRHDTRHARTPLEVKWQPYAVPPGCAACSAAATLSL